MIHIDQGYGSGFIGLVGVKFVLWPFQTFSTHYRYMRSNIMICLHEMPGNSLHCVLQCVTL